MKKTVLSFLAICIAITTMQAQNEPVNPFEEFGYKPKIATLSKGKYVEFYDQDTIVQIGGAIFNTVTMKIMGFVEYDTIRNEYNISPEVISRWLSPDPLTSEFPSWSPYNYVENNPINLIDPTGLAPWKPEVTDDGTTIYIAEAGDTKASFASQYGLSMGQVNQISGNQIIKQGSIISGQNVFNVTGNEALRLDLSSSQATDQRIFDQFLFSRDHASSKGSYAAPTDRYFSNTIAKAGDALGGIGSVSGFANLNVGTETIKLSFNLPLYRVSFDGSGTATALGTNPTYDKQTSGNQFKNQLNTLFPFYHPKTGKRIGDFTISTTSDDGNALQDRFNRDIPKYDYNNTNPIDTGNE